MSKNASAGNRTRIDCLEGNHANRYTTDACWLLREVICMSFLATDLAYIPLLFTSTSLSHKICFQGRVRLSS